jgi:hypothetical protein
MREIRTSGSEGGGAGNLTGPPYPYMSTAPAGLSSKTMRDWPCRQEARRRNPERTSGTWY